MEAQTKFLDPKAIIDQLNIEFNAVIADFGCGPGFFTIPLAQKTREGGKILSFDVLPQALESIESQAKNLGLTNIEVKRVNLEKIGGSKLEDQSVDWVILKDMLFQNQHKDLILAEAARVLKPTGRILIVEWNELYAGIGPDQSQRVSKKSLELLLAQSKLTAAQEIQAGGFHYAFVVKKIA